MKVEVSSGIAYRLMYPRLTILVTSVSKQGKPNIITLAWSLPTSFQPPMVAISIARRRYSHKLIAETKEFVVNIPTIEISKETLFCGRNSGKDCDKFKQTGLTPVPAKVVAPPLIQECIAHLECRVINSLVTGDHTLFIGEVIAASVNKDIFNDKYKAAKIKPIYHIGGDDFLTITPKKIRPGL